MAGPSHVMPTGGTARFASPINVNDFVKIVSIIGLNETGPGRYRSRRRDSGAEPRAYRPCRGRPPATGGVARMNIHRHTFSPQDLLRPEVVGHGGVHADPALRGAEPAAGHARRAASSSSTPTRIPTARCPAVAEALAEYPYYHIYPDPQQTELREALSAMSGVPAEHILPSHGADEMLDYLCRLFLRPGRRHHQLPAHLWHVQLRRRSGRRPVSSRCGARADYSVDVERLSVIGDRGSRDW